MSDTIFTGTWVNQHKSTLELAVKNGVVSGTFDSGVSDGGQPLKMPVQGRTQGDQITFNVLYPMFKSMVTWVGQIRDDAAKPIVMETVWIHATDLEEAHEPDGLWGFVKTGGDHFVRQ